MSELGTTKRTTRGRGRQCTGAHRVHEQQTHTAQSADAMEEQLGNASFAVDATDQIRHRLSTAPSTRLCGWMLLLIVLRDDIVTFEVFERVIRESITQREAHGIIIRMLQRRTNKTRHQTEH
jgi:hypothetical protein